MHFCVNVMPRVRQVVDLQMQLDTREEELRLAQKANKREKVAKMANEVRCLTAWGYQTCILWCHAWPSLW